MSRWFFANEREVCQESEEKEPTNEFVDEDAYVRANAPPEIPYTLWSFCVRNRESMHGNERIGITGNCEILGNWVPAQAYVMNKKADSDKFEADIKIPRNITIEYRYVMLAWNPLKEEIIARHWETHVQPRKVRPCDNMLRDCEVFGIQDNDYRVNRAWPIFETYVQFKLFNAPFYFAKGFAKRLLYVKVTPMYPVPTPQCVENVVEPLRLTIFTKVVTTDICAEMGYSSELAFAEVCTLNSQYGNILQMQPEWGVRCGPEDLVLFHLTTAYMEITRYRFDLYTYAYKAGSDEPPYHFGYGYVMPEQLVGSEGFIKFKITCASTHRPLCHMSVEYLLIRPLADSVLTMEKTFERSWDHDKLAYHIGRRGCGQSFESEKLGLIRENTIASFNRAATNAADWVKMNVMLSSDSLPVIHHDHVLRVVHKPSAPIEELLKDHDILVFPMKHFTQKELRNMAGSSTRSESKIAFQQFCHGKLRKCQAFRFAASEFGNQNCERMLHEQMPFPLLEEVIEEVSPMLGFVIEVRWVQKNTNNRWQEGGFKPTFDRNYYVDQILQVVLQKIGSRPVIFASYDCDICTLMRFKQNQFPVMLITHNPHCPVQFKDLRFKDINTAACTAEALDLYGLIVHANTLLDNPSISQMIQFHKLITFAHGTPLSDMEERNKIKSYGVQGVIFDRIDQLNQGGTPVKPQFFMIETPFNKVLFDRLLLRELTDKCGYNAEEDIENPQLPYEKKSEISWKFCVYAGRDIPLQSNVYFAITGNCKPLGFWNPKEALTMIRSKDRPKLWTVDVDLPRDRLVRYRYFIYARDPILDNDSKYIHIRFWETHLVCRSIFPNQQKSKEADRFGHFNNIVRIQRGWLNSNEMFLYFKIFRAPFKCNGIFNTQHTTFYVHVTRLCESTCTDFVYPKKEPCTEFDFCDVANLSKSGSCELQSQKPYGVRCGSEDLINFRITVSSRELTVYRFDLFYFAHMEQTPTHLGYGFLMPEDVFETEGYAEVLINTIIEDIKEFKITLSYLWITPLENADKMFTMEKTYARYWSKHRPSTRIGHRGCGATYQYEDDVIRENTIHSLNRAGDHGADMVEFDVMLTSDGQPVVYHDHILNMNIGLDMPFEEVLNFQDVFVLPSDAFNMETLEDMSMARTKQRLIFPVSKFTYEQLSKLRVYRFSKVPYDVTKEQLIFEQRPFPLLEDIMTKTNAGLGLFIEVKWLQKLSDGCWEEGTFEPEFDRNFYVDEILKVVLPNAACRRIVFTSYDCDICTMLRVKQNLFPVMLMCRNPFQASYMDPRVSTRINCVLTAHSFEFLGIVDHINAIIQVMEHSSDVKPRGLVNFCWGEAVVLRELRTKILSKGITGIIFDRIDRLDQLGSQKYSKFLYLETEELKEEFAEILAKELEIKCIPARRTTLKSIPSARSNSARVSTYSARVSTHSAK